MPYTTLVAGTTITASWANANVRDQTIVPFATTAARDSAITSPVQGMVAAITDDDMLTVYNGSAWIEYGRWGTWATYTPTVTQSGSVAATVIIADYVRTGSAVTVQVRLNITGSGTAGNNIVVSLPINPKAVYASNSATIGIGAIVDTSASVKYKGEAVAAASGTQVAFIRTDTSDTNGIGTVPSFALASGDVVLFSVTYQV